MSRGRRRTSPRACRLPTPSGSPVASSVRDLAGTPRYTLGPSLCPVHAEKQPMTDLDKFASRTRGGIRHMRK